MGESDGLDSNACDGAGVDGGAAKVAVVAAVVVTLAVQRYLPLLYEPKQLGV